MTTQFRCGACGAEFPSQAQMNVHGEAHRAALECSTCGATFESQEQLSEHARQHAEAA